jgi:hypothetical protein
VPATKIPKKEGFPMYFPFFGYRKVILCFIAFGLFAVSCSSNAKLELSPVKGTVLVKDKPAGGVLLTFIPVTESAGATPLRPIAITAEDGTFIVRTDEEEGAPAGDYMVTAVWMQDAPAAKKTKTISMKMGEDRVDKLGGKYRDRTKGIKVTIKKGANDLDPFKLQ